MRVLLAVAVVVVSGCMLHEHYVEEPKVTKTFPVDSLESLGAQLVDTQGRPLEHARVWVISVDEDGWSERQYDEGATNGRGRAAFELPPSRYELHLAYAKTWDELTERTIELEVARGYRTCCRGRIHVGEQRGDDVACSVEVVDTEGPTCSGDPDLEQRAPRPAPETRPFFTVVKPRWWERARPCPDGARLVGAAPPAGTQIWCEWSASNRPDTRHGPFTTWFPNGERKSERLFRRDRMIGTHREWFETGQLALEERYIDSDAGIESRRLDGVQTIWFPNGQRRRQIEYRRGCADGMKRTWFENGRLEEEATYACDRLEGAVRRWHDNGQLASERTYVHGLEDGTSRVWTRDGALRGEYAMEKGTGQRVEWYADGTKVEAAMVGGHFDGLWRMWSPRGVLVREAHYRSGRLDGVETRWDDDGGLREEHQWRDGCPVGTWKTWSAGKLTTSDGRFSGRFGGNHSCYE